MAYTAFGAAPHPSDVVVYAMPSPHTRLEGFADGGRNGTGGSASAPLLDSSVCSSPSLPTAYTGSTPPKPTGTMARPAAAPGAPGAPPAPRAPGAPARGVAPGPPCRGGLARPD